MTTVTPFIVGGHGRGGERAIEVASPYDGRVVAAVAMAAARDVEDAIAGAAAAARTLAAWPAWRRAESLRSVAAALGERREPFARTIALEAGKPITQARVEVERAILTCRTAAEEALRIDGEVLALDVAPGMEGRVGIVRRFPVGPVACITPFNFPLNLVAHKIAPAIAAGCPFVLKPASKTPLSALALAGLFLDAGVPPEAVSVLPLPGSHATALIEDDRLRALSFTGSPGVGWELRGRCGRKKVTLELGGNAAVIVDRSADLDLAVARIVAGGYAHAGQSCVSVQRVYAHAEIFETLRDRLVAAVRALRVGDPADEATDVGPLITVEEALRVASWIDEARGAGAQILTGGARDGAIVAPAVLSRARPDLAVCSREAFAPLLVVEPFETIGEALAAADASAYGLQAGLFTRDLGAAWRAFETLEVGAVVVNDVPTWRADPMPYGGVKASGIGREGPRYAIEDYTEPRLLVLNTAALR